MWFGPVLPDPGQLLSGLGQELLSNRDGQFEVVRCLLHRPSNNQHILVDQLTMRVLRRKKEGIFKKNGGVSDNFFTTKTLLLSGEGHFLQTRSHSDGRTGVPVCGGWGRRRGRGAVM